VDPASSGKPGRHAVGRAGGGSRSSASTPAKEAGHGRSVPVGNQAGGGLAVGDFFLLGRGRFCSTDTAEENNADGGGRL
jgi:hypothetical protein